MSFPYIEPLKGVPATRIDTDLTKAANPLYTALMASLIMCSLKLDAPAPEAFFSSLTFDCVILPVWNTPKGFPFRPSLSQVPA